MTSGKLGQSKASQKLHSNNESSLRSGSSKHLAPQRDISQKYLTDKQSSSSINLKQHAQSHQFNNSYLASQHHASQMHNASTSDMAGRGSAQDPSFHHQKGYANHQIFKQSSSSGSGLQKGVQPRRQNVSAGGASMGPLGHHSSMGIHPQSSHGTRSGPYDKLKKKMVSRQ